MRTEESKCDRVKDNKSVRYISFTPSPWTTPVDLIHTLIEWTSLDYPRWTTLIFVANINFTVQEPKQKMQSIHRETKVTEHFRFKRFSDPDDQNGCNLILKLFLP